MPSQSTEAGIEYSNNQLHFLGNALGVGSRKPSINSQLQMCTWELIEPRLYFCQDKFDWNRFGNDFINRGVHR